MPLSITSRHCGNLFIAQCKGSLIVGDEVKTLDAGLINATRQYTRIILNVGEVNRVDSTGLGLLVRHASNLHKRGGDIRLAAAQPFLIKLLNLASLTGILQVHATEEEAMLSFLRDRSNKNVAEKTGQRVLFFDPSADLCAFINAVLTQHGYEVRSTNNFGDAKVLLRVDDVEFVLVGPGTPQLSSETALRSLRPLAPKATSLTLGEDFNDQDAHEATERLLQLFSTHRPAGL